MRRLLPVIFAFALFIGVVPTFAQNPNYDVGPVWRVTYFKLKPGMGDAFWKDFRDHVKPILDEEKKQGLITDYKTFTNVTSNQPNDWDVARAVAYPNWAALDQIDAKVASMAVKHFGSREALAEASRKRAEIAEVVASHLVHEVSPK